MKRSVAPILWFHKHQLKDKDKDAEKKECKSTWKFPRVIICQLAALIWLCAISIVRRYLWEDMGPLEWHIWWLVTPLVFAYMPKDLPEAVVMLRWFESGTRIVFLQLWEMISVYIKSAGRCFHPVLKETNATNKNHHKPKLWEMLWPGSEAASTSMMCHNSYCTNNVQAPRCQWHNGIMAAPCNCNVMQL